MIYLIINMSIILLCYIYYYKEKDRIISRYIQKRKKQIDQELKESVTERLKHCEELDKELECRSRTLQEKEKQLREVEDRRYHLDEKLQNYEEEQKQSIDHYIQIIKEIKTNEAMFQLEQEFEKIRQSEEEKQKQILLSYDSIRKEQQSEIAILSKQLDDFRAKQETINQEMLRRRELQEKADFYRVCLSDEAIADINLLQVTRQNLKKPEIIDKIIYDTYVAKPVLEMIKRVLQNSTCSGIYKITCQETKEIYIGKSTDVKNRWQQHCKTAFNCGTIASSLLHRKMKQYGIENFTFELLEKVPKDQLSEREKFYIDFYKTKETGLNERSG